MKKAILIILILIVLILAVTAGLLIRLRIRTDRIRTDFSPVFENEKYSEPVSVEGVEVITQDVSCGYAFIEMFFRMERRISDGSGSVCRIRQGRNIDRRPIL